MRGARSVIVAARVCTRAAASVIIGEWNACDDASRACATPLSRRCAANPSIASTGPDTTHCSGPLTAARASVGGSCAASSSSAIDTDSIAPAGCACIAAARAATRSIASSSENTPAQHAATNSPRLWPIR
ncbi:hypothetical protein BamIOP4010DRAFT_6897 [Burkholderia ambifaria IOP40-10]|uniref:Uncharacterized protein n=1 Tax=Burkholderia ambifaria IOP40-10 TaxID=396596 RepID=B1FS84_9BURK|nr:hypothetical protein BamIOP4010DRAFT_6897 [Burkholderia ambifaria IOP40-10]